MLIREAKSSDANAVASFIVMAEKEMVRYFTGVEEPEEAAKRLLPLVLSPTSNRYSLANNLVAEIDGVPAGSIIHFPADRQPELDILLLAQIRSYGFDVDKLFFEGEPGTYYLSTMGVNPDFRGRGVGTALMAAAEAKGIKLGFSLCSLLVSTEKPKVQAMYERLGYRVIADVSIAESHYRRMTKDIKPR